MMEIDVNLLNSKPMELREIASDSTANKYCNNNAPARSLTPPPSSLVVDTAGGTRTTATPSSDRPMGCCGILGRLLCTGTGCGSAAKTSSSSQDYLSGWGPSTVSSMFSQQQQLPPINYSLTNPRKNQHRRRSPQEIYFESRGKSCKKLLKFNGHSNKVLLYPEEGWARTASSSYWTITPCWWQPNRCRIEEYTGTQRRQATKAKMMPLEQGSLLIAGQFRGTSSSTNCTYNCNGNNYNVSNKKNQLRTYNACNNNNCHNCCASRGHCNRNCNHNCKDKDYVDEFKLYLSSNITMEDYNMGYCLTGFVERRCPQTNTFQMTHFAVIKRQWPSISNTNNKSTNHKGSSNTIKST